MLHLDSYQNERMGRLQKIVPKINPVINPLINVGLLGYNGDGYGSQVDGKFYPQIAREDLLQALLPYIERIEAMSDPVIAVLPDVRAMDAGQLNRINMQRRFTDAPIPKENLIEMPSTKNLPEFWRSGTSLKDLYAAVVDDRKMPLQGNYYEPPFPGWNVIVCEKKLSSPVGEPYCENLVSKDSPYVALTPNEAFMMQALWLTEQESCEAEVLLGHYDAKNNTFPVLLCSKGKTDGDEYEIGHVNASETQLGDFPESETNLIVRMRARKGFRLQSLSTVVQDFLTDDLVHSGEDLRREMGALLGKKVAPQPTVVPETFRIHTDTANAATAIRAIKQLQRETRITVNALFMAMAKMKWKKEMGDDNYNEAALRRDLEAYGRRIGELDRENRQLKQEVKELKTKQTVPAAAPAPARVEGLQITPESLRTMTTVALKKLQKALVLCFHPDMNQGRPNEDYSKINNAIHAELDRRGSR